MEEPQPEPEWRAAGVLPYTVLGGEVLCLLGKEYSLAPTTQRLLLGPIDPKATAPLESGEGHYRSWWSDFGGGREADDESVAATAAREWAEESLGVYGDGSDMAARVASSAASMRACLSATAAPGALGPVCRVVSEAYTMFAVAVPFVDTLIFQLARDENDAEAAEECNEEESAQGALRRRVGEKRDFAWVSLASLLAAVSGGKTRLRDKEGQTLTLLPRLGFALKSSGAAVLERVSAGAPSSVPVTVLHVPSSRAEGGHSLYICPRRGDSAEGEISQEQAATALQRAATSIARFGRISRAVLHRYAAPKETSAAAAAAATTVVPRVGKRLGDPFALITFADSSAAADAQRWLSGDDALVAEFAFFEPSKKRRGGPTSRRKTLAGPGADSKAGGAGQKRQGAGSRRNGVGARKSLRGRKSLLGVRPASNAALLGQKRAESA